MNDFINEASKALHISEKRLRDPNGLTPAEEMAFDDWRINGLDWDYIWRLQAAPSARALELAPDYPELQPSFIQSLINLSQMSSVPRMEDNFVVVPDGLGTISQLQKGKLGRFISILRDVQALYWAAYELDEGRGQPDGKFLDAPNPLMGFVIDHIDQEGHLRNAMLAINECDLELLNERIMSIQQKPGNIRPADWIFEAAKRIHSLHPNFTSRRFAALIKGIYGNNHKKRTGARAAWGLVAM